MKSEYRKKKDAEERVSHVLKQTKERLGIVAGRNQVHLSRTHGSGKLTQRRHQIEYPTRLLRATPCMPTNGSEGFAETEATVKEIRRKASKIAPACNKGALQYMPDDNSD
jgi:hypothetical protein